MAGLIDFTNEEEVQEHLNNTEIEFMFGCHKEHNEDSCYRLGEFLDTIRKRFREAATVYKNCCKEFKNAPCCFKTGQYHMLGRGGLEKSRLEAFKHYYVGCQQDCYSDHGKNDKIASSCCNMGMLLSQDKENRPKYIDALQNLDGRKEQDTSKLLGNTVVNAYSRACELNDPVGCNLLSQLYIKGFETTCSNFTLAAKYAEKCCDLGDSRGCHNLSIMYARGDGVQKCNEKAAEFAAKSREIIEGNTSLSFGDK